MPRKKSNRNRCAYVNPQGPTGFRCRSSMPCPKHPPAPLRPVHDANLAHKQLWGEMWRFHAPTRPIILYRRPK